MTGTAIAFLLLAIIVLWGGLALAVMYYVRSGAAGGQPRRDREGHVTWPRDT
ncbi:MetS family NSS transporter small subunit [Ornithinimicrobium sp. F0845]|uniref:MetS family NSS transporter small subunit n=1 Tax=Ornithinimicrobium sp. F0845 TaxID=2926412 RepID=UPI001FF27FCF|nr:MetS family NSS transporter small subunit [Ornithinimicrobium sp. F0845]MCK0110662.1 MetS family NSS transporter small subunit [Ornithinimicrobium sp. F0845]